MADAAESGNEPPQDGFAYDALHADTRMILDRRQNGANSWIQRTAKPTVSRVLTLIRHWMRERLGFADRGGDDQALPPGPAAPPDAPPGPAGAGRKAKDTRPLCGIALSGGGIRSATLSLGVLQAMAGQRGSSAAAAAPSTPPAAFTESRLYDFEYLSTVSGGGYAGAFLCSLFIPRRLDRSGSLRPSDAADQALRVLCTEPPGRLRAALGTFAGAAPAPASPETHAPLAWLRDNGRYLAPTGSGDAFYAGSLALRNLVSVHVVIGALLLTALGALALVQVLLQSWLPSATAEGKGLWLACATGSFIDGWYFGPAFAFAALILLLWAIPAGAAFWIPYPVGRAGACSRWNWACTAYLGTAAVFAGMSMAWAVTVKPGLWAGLWAYGALVALLALLMFVALRNGGGGADVSGLRTALTRSFNTALQWVLGLLVLGVLDTIAHTLYAAILAQADSSGGRAGALLAPASVAGALMWVVRKLAFSAGSTAPPKWLGQLSWQWLCAAAGFLILGLMAVWWGLIAVAMIWTGEPLAEPLTATTLAPVFVPGRSALILTLVALALSVTIGQFPSFINLSSLQSFYAARLTRAYLGASNGERFQAGAGSPQRASAAEPLPGDQVELSQFVGGASGGSGGKAIPSRVQPWLATYAPLQLINVTMANTDAPGEQLVQRDRKGQPLVVTPRWFSIDGGEHHDFPRHVSVARFELERTLTLGQWTGISGAAASTAMGRDTSLGLSLLLGAANVRLGTWWCSSLKPTGSAKACELLFRTQSHLFNEFSARFHGTARRYQYLTDGGHFENTGVYELLRPERGVRLILACDHGADPGYAFGDLANLIRLVRIDMQIELEVDQRAKTVPDLEDIFGVPADFRRPHRPGATEPIAILLRARQTRRPAAPPAWVVLLKPRVLAGSAADVAEYQRAHPAFPQQSTGDQFFDEAQWESYRKLGFDNAKLLLQEPVWNALLRHTGLRPPSP